MAEALKRLLLQTKAPIGAVHGKGGTMTDAEMHARFDRLQTDFGAVVSGLAQMNETLATHSELLGQILTAATQTAPPSDLAQALKRIAEILTSQGGTLEQVEERLADLVDALKAEAT